MPANKYALLRYRVIDKCIRQMSYPNKERIREACEEALYGGGSGRVSISTIEKDIWAMKNESELGYYAPINYSVKYKGYEYLEEGYSIDDLPLNDEDLEAIRFASATLKQFKDIPVFKQFDFALNKLFDRMEMRRSSDEPADFVLFEEHYSAKGREHLMPLFEAIRDRNEVAVDYQKFGTVTNTRYQIRPALLKEFHHRWYLIGWQEEKKRFVTLGLDRIQAIESLDLKFEATLIEQAKTIFDHAVGITSKTVAPEKVVLEFDAMQGNYIKTQPIHHSQQVIADTDQQVTVQMEVLITHDLMLEILSHGEKVKVLSPEHLANDVRRLYQSALAHYQ